MMGWACCIDGFSFNQSVFGQGGFQTERGLRKCAYNAESNHYAYKIRDSSRKESLGGARSKWKDGREDWKLIELTLDRVQQRS
jgi:hypothetical protein